MTAHLLDRAERITPDAVELLRRLVEIESPSGDEAGTLEAGAFLVGEVEGRGGRVRRVPAPGLGEHLAVDFGAAERPLLVIGHLDTVHPRGTLARCPFRREAGRLHGPGVYDMKASWAASLAALDLLALEGRRPAPTRWIVTCDEEIGAPTSRALLEEAGRSARGALVLEPPIPGGAIKVRRKGVARYTIGVAGRPAHAGVEPERGANAIRELARVVLEVSAAADPASGTTVSVGVIRGGTAVNVVPEEARAEVDVRFWTAEEGERVDALLRGLRPTDPGCRIEVTGGIDRGPLEPGGGAGLVATVIEAAARLGRALETGPTGGASDGQLLAAVGCPVADGLGVDGGGAHTLDEHVALGDLPFRIALYAELFAEP